MIYGQISIVTPPDGYPVSVQDVKTHTRIMLDDDDPLLGIYLASATTLIEQFLNRSLLTRTLNYVCAESFPQQQWPMMPAPAYILPLSMQYNINHMLIRDLELPYAPVQAVNTVTIAQWDTDGPTELSSDQYQFVSIPAPLVRLSSDVVWYNRQYVAIEYVAGYGTAAEVPVSIKHALLMTTAWLYEHRGDQEMDTALPNAAQALLWPYRQLSFA